MNSKPFLSVTGPKPVHSDQVVGEDLMPFEIIETIIVGMVGSE